MTCLYQARKLIEWSCLYVYRFCLSYDFSSGYWWLIWFLVFNATFSSISAISWRPVLVVEEAGEPPTMGNQLVSFITKPGAIPRRIGDRLVTHWATQAQWILCFFVICAFLLFVLFVLLLFCYFVICAFLLFYFNATLQSILGNTQCTGAHRGRYRIVVGFTTTYAISAYHHWCCEFESWSGEGVQYCDKVWVTCNRSISSTNKTDGHDITEILLKVALNTIKQTITNIPKEMIMWPIPLSPL